VTGKNSQEEEREWEGQSSRARKSILLEGTNRGAGRGRTPGNLKDLGTKSETSKKKSEEVMGVTSKVGDVGSGGLKAFEGLNGGGGGGLKVSKGKSHPG